MSLLSFLGRNISGYHNISSGQVLFHDVCDLGLQPDFINLTCTINYRGFAPPVIKWTKNICNCLDASLVVSSQIVNSTVISTVIVPAKLQADMSNLKYSCQVYINAESESSELSWSSPLFKSIG